MAINQDTVRRAMEYAAIFSVSTGVQCFADFNAGGADDAVSPFCTCLHKTTGTSTPCRKLFGYAAGQAERFGGQYIFMCPDYNMCHFAAPVIDSGLTVGLLLCGPVLMTDRDDFFTEDVCRRHGISPEDADALERLFSGIPQITPERVRCLADALTIFSDELNGVGQLDERQKMLKQQADISNYIHMNKEFDSGHPYQFDRESELIGCIERGDSAEARRLLNIVLANIYLSSGNRLDSIKARVTELIVLLSRSVINCGADPDLIFGMNYQYMREINACVDVEQLSLWLSRVINRFCDDVVETRVTRHSGILSLALGFINSGFMLGITLKDVAAHVHLAPTYFCRIFKEGMGLSFSEYLIRLRVDLAKKLLVSPELSLVDVASLSGFCDQSYFSKVFKLQTGTTPKKYRQEKMRIIREEKQ